MVPNLDCVHIYVEFPTWRLVLADKDNISYHTWRHPWDAGQYSFREIPPTIVTSCDMNRFTDMACCFCSSVCLALIGSRAPMLLFHHRISATVPLLLLLHSWQFPALVGWHYSLPGCYNALVTTRCSIPTIIPHRSHTASSTDSHRKTVYARYK